MTAKYYPQIDGLRALAVVPVMVSHCWENLLPGGRNGVDLFFVISGFVITNIILNEFDHKSSISLKNFYFRRIFRIMPALFAVCIFTTIFIVVCTTMYPPAGGLKKLAVVFLALSSTMNWARALEISGGGMLGHTWSLSVEEQFYLVWPLMLSIFLPRGITRKRILSGAIVAIILIFFWRTALLAYGSNAHRLLNGTDTRADEILIGCAIALSKLKANNNLLSKLWALPVVIYLSCIIFGSSSGIANYQIEYILVLCSSAWIVLLARDEVVPSFKLLESRAFLYIGKRSYSLYLWHYPLVVAFLLLGIINPVTGGIIFVSSFFIADVSFNFIEKPFLKMKNRIEQERENAKFNHTMDVRSIETPPLL